MTGRSDATPGGIMFLIRSLHPGGAERQLVELAKGLHRRGHAVFVAVFYAEGVLLAELQDVGVPVATLNKRGRWDVVGFWWRLIRLVRSIKPRVLYAFLVEPNLHTVLVKALRPGTGTVWGVRAADMTLAAYGWFPRFTFWLSRFLSRYADLIIVNSHAGAVYHQSLGYPAARMVVVPNGIDVEQFHPDAELRRRVRAEWGIDADSAVIGCAARLDPIKDHPTLLAAAALVKRARADVRLVLAGAGSAVYRAALEARAASLDMAERVLWLGTCSNMVAIYNGFDVCCLTSRGEGFPNVLAEAMACGVPCVATDVGDTAQILNGYGHVVPAGDASGLAQGILATLENTNPDRGLACRRRIVDEFSVGKMVAQTERLLKDRFNVAS